MEIFPSLRGILRISGLGVQRESPLEQYGPVGGGARLFPKSGMRLELGLPPDCEVSVLCLTGCSGFRIVAGEPWIYQGLPRTEIAEPIALKAPAPIGLPMLGPSGGICPTKSAHKYCHLW